MFFDFLLINHLALLPHSAQFNGPIHFLLDQTSLNAAGVAIPTPLLSQEFLTGTFSVVPFTRKFFMIVEWTTVAAAATHVGQFTPADIGRILVQQNLADATLKPGQAHIVGYNTFDQAVTAQWASTNAPQMVPFSYISMEAVAAFQYDATVATTYQGQQLSVQFNADRSVALTSNASLPLNAAVFAEQFNADGSLAYRGSWLVVSALSGTVYQATELLGYTAPSDLSPVTFLPGQWKVFSLSSPTAGAPVTSWYLQVGDRSKSEINIETMNDGKKHRNCVILNGKWKKRAKLRLFLVICHGDFPDLEHSMLNLMNVPKMNFWHRSGKQWGHRGHDLARFRLCALWRPMQRVLLAPWVL